MVQVSEITEKLSQRGGWEMVAIPGFVVF
jgi:phenylalanine-4-hydroxylase